MGKESNSFGRVWQNEESLPQFGACRLASLVVGAKGPAGLAGRVPTTPAEDSRKQSAEVQARRRPAVGKRSDFLSVQLFFLRCRADPRAVLLRHRGAGIGPGIEPVQDQRFDNSLRVGKMTGAIVLEGFE